MTKIQADLINAIQQVADEHNASIRKLSRLLYHEAKLYEQYPTLALDPNRMNTNEHNDIRAHEIIDPSAHTTLDSFEQTD
jgi:Tfp pilus assembly protein PilP